MQDLTVVHGDGSELAGAVVYWELRGGTLLADLVEELGSAELAGVAASLEEPIMERVLWRSAQAAIRGKRMILRPTGRNTWEILSEKLGGDEYNEPRVHHTSVCTGRVVKRDDAKHPQVRPSYPEHAEFAQQIVDGMRAHAGALTPEDVSSWLLGVADSPAVQAVGLRRAGGFYFVPAGPGLELWRAVAAAVGRASSSVMHELPAMSTQECARSVISAVRREADAAFDEMEAYLSGETSTKGLNSVARRVQEAQAKVDHYAALFGADVRDLQDRSGRLVGAIAMARLEVDAQRDRAAAASQG